MGPICRSTRSAPPQTAKSAGKSPLTPAARRFNAAPASEQTSTPRNLKTHALARNDWAGAAPAQRRCAFLWIGHFKVRNVCSAFVEGPWHTQPEQGLGFQAGETVNRRQNLPSPVTPAASRLTGTHCWVGIYLHTSRRAAQNRATRDPPPRSMQAPSESPPRHVTTAFTFFFAFMRPLPMDCGRRLACRKRGDWMCGVA